MTPLYEHRQVAWPTVIASLTSALLLAVGIAVAGRNSRVHLGLLALVPAISVVVLAFFGSMTVRVFSDRVRIHFGIGAPWFTIDLREARGYAVVRNPWFYGWGIHLIPGGVIYHYYYFGDQAKTGENSKNVALHYFRNGDPGAFVSISGAGVLASSKHQAQAQAFVKWVSGKGGQEVLRDGDSFEYAVGIGADSNPKLAPLAKLQAPKVEPSKLNNRKVTDLMTEAGLL